MKRITAFVGSARRRHTYNAAEQFLPRTATCNGSYKRVILF
jgi:hypothetical protein